MSKLQYTMQAEGRKQTTGRPPARPIIDDQSRRAHTKQARRDVALDMIGHFLHSYFRIDSYKEKERVIQW